MSLWRGRIVSCAIGVALGAGSLAQIPPVQVIPFTGSFFPSPRDLSSNGLFAIGSINDGAVQNSARWNEYGVPTLVGLTIPFGTVSNDGLSVAGTVSGSPSQVFRWSASSGVVFLDPNPTQNGSSSSVGISPDGSTIIGNWLGNTLAYRWTQNSGMVTISPGFVAIKASQDTRAIIGKVTGLPAVWTEQSGIISIPVPPGGGVNTPQSVSDDGSVAYGTLSLTNQKRTWKWTLAGGTHIISETTVAAGQCTSDGLVMVSGTGSTQIMSIYFEPLGLIPLESFLIANGIFSGYGNQCVDISSDGRRVLTRLNSNDGGYYILLPRYVSGRVIFRDLAGGALPPSQALLEYRLPGTMQVVASTFADLDTFGRYFVASPDPMGEYDLSVKVGHWLRRTIRIDTASRSLINNTILRLGNGDVDGDNEVGIGDYAQLSQAFGSEFGDEQFNPLADLNEDLGVDIGDYAILSTNFGTAGDE